VLVLVRQIEVYEQIRNGGRKLIDGSHSAEIKELVRAFIAKLEEIPDGCAECFPFELVEKLKEKFLSD
jgi:hypothetical protein